MSNNHPEWTPTAMSLYAGARCLAYLMVAVAGLDVAFGRLGQTGQSTSHLWVDIIGVSAAIGGTVAMVGTIFRRWKLEWFAVALITTVLGIYTMLDWYVLLFIVGYPPLPLAATALLAGTAVVLAVSTGKRNWRWAAVLGAAVVLAIAVPLSARNPALITALTAFAAGRYVELWLFSDRAVQARRMSPGAVAP